MGDVCMRKIPGVKESESRQHPSRISRVGGVAVLRCLEVLRKELKAALKCMPCSCLSYAWDSMRRKLIDGSSVKPRQPRGNYRQKYWLPFVRYPCLIGMREQSLQDTPRNIQ